MTDYDVEATDYAGPTYDSPILGEPGALAELIGGREGQLAEQHFGVAAQLPDFGATPRRAARRLLPSRGARVKVSVSPANWNAQGRIYRRGRYMIAVVHLQGAGTPQVVRAKVDLVPIARAVQRWHREQHRRLREPNAPEYEQHPVIGGLFKKIRKKARKLGKKVVRAKVFKAVRRFTPKPIRKMVKRAGKSVQSLARGNFKRAFKMAAPLVMKANPYAAAAYVAANGVMRMVKSKKKKVRKVGLRALAEVVKGAKRGDRSQLKNLQILREVAKARKKLTRNAARSAAGVRGSQLPGILVVQDGRLVRGQFYQQL